MQTKEEINRKNRECARRWREKNKEKILEYQREYRKSPVVVGRIKEQNKKYYSNPENKKRSLEKMKRYRNDEENRESIALSKKRWADSNKEKVERSRDRWEKNNPDKLKKSLKKYCDKPRVRYKINIRSKTNKHFPLINQKCSCGSIAECHHHTTEPYKYNKFEFTCIKCHNELHKNGGLKL